MRGSAAFQCRQLSCVHAGILVHDAVLSTPLSAAEVCAGAKNYESNGAGMGQHIAIVYWLI